MPVLDELRTKLRLSGSLEEGALLNRLIAAADLSDADRRAISAHAEGLVRRVRENARQGLMESFLAEYGLATEEGVALMSLAEALLRVPDSETVDALIQDKVATSDWTAHFGSSKSPFVNFSTWALSLTSDVLGEHEAAPRSILDRVVKKLGEPVIRVAVSQAMRMLGSQFVFGRTIEEATTNAAPWEKNGYRFSFDMLGEAARTSADAARYTEAYAAAIAHLSHHSRSAEGHENPGISVKLSALHPRYEFAQRDRVLRELTGRVSGLARAARAADMTFNIDAEEADRLDLSLDVIEAVLADPALAGWNGFGVVVQAYGKRVIPVIEWLDALAEKLDRRIMVRLVKGAYWDAEIKRAQVLGLPDYPVFTRKAATDVSYIAAARTLLQSRRIYPQFATHNAHTAAAVLHLAKVVGRTVDDFEFQRLHGMGEALHEALLREAKTRSRIYAPVGPHKELLAYLVRRLLENGANGSFVYQIADESVPADKVAEDPIAKILALGDAVANPAIVRPSALFGAGRRNSAGLDIADPAVLAPVSRDRDRFRTHRWAARPLIVGAATPDRPIDVHNPADDGDVVGAVANASAGDVDVAFAAAQSGFLAWKAHLASDRAGLLRRAAALYEEHRAELFALLAREAGKTLADAVGEVREAVDFLRYYASEAEARPHAQPRGTIVCISPWNFPLAIFTGQIAAALAAGNVVLAKPAAQTPLIAHRAVELLHEAGIPAAALQFLPGDGASVGAALVADPRAAGVCFTGSLPTARRIDQAMAVAMPPNAPLIAETGGLNAMIVDSTALPEQAVRDVITSAFQSAGQRCSALRILYLQEEVAEPILKMLMGAMDELQLGDPWLLATDVGPVIDRAARDRIDAHVARYAARGAVLKRLLPPAAGSFVAPTLLRTSGVSEIGEEVFGPVLHVATFAAADLEKVVEEINASGYGLTFGLHTRLSSRVRELSSAVQAGNIYVNRNQIGAVVGSQPFGGEGLSGTGPKAGGPNYLPRFQIPRVEEPIPSGERVMPGPTGESNILGFHPRSALLCLGPEPDDLQKQIDLATRAGVAAIEGEAGFDPVTLGSDDGFDAVAYFGADSTLKAIRIALSEREGPILPLLTSPGDAPKLIIERHVCIDTTAAGGNASLMAQAGED